METGRVGRVGVGLALLTAFAGGGCGTDEGSAVGFSLAKACILQASCPDLNWRSAGLSSLDSGQACIRMFTEPHDDEIPIPSVISACLERNSGSCEDMALCLDVLPRAPCDPATYEEHCDGSIGVVCQPLAEGGVVQSTDCSLLTPDDSLPQPMTCYLAHGRWAECQLPGFDGVQGQCMGQMAVNQFELEGFHTEDCSHYEDAHCEVGELGARCIGDGPACSGGDQVLRCDGDVEVWCLGRHEARRDCGQYGPWTCTRRDEYDPFACAATHHDCGATSLSFACEGASVAYCDSGVPRRMDCRALGFTGCSVVDGAARCI
jgi:hypothetical protein